MTLQEAIDLSMTRRTFKVTNPRLAARSSVVEHNGVDQTLSLKRVNAPLSTPWTPTIRDLFATDWTTA